MTNSRNLLLAVFFVSLIILLGSLLLLFSFMLEVSSLLPFMILFFATFFVTFPRRLLSPLTIIHSYYFIWFLFAPVFSQRHFEDYFVSQYHYLAYWMIFMTHLSAAIGSIIGEKTALRQHYLIWDLVPWKPSMSLKNVNGIIIFLYVTATSFLILIVINSGGFGYWANNPGDAFLNRQGTGVYVIFSHFFTFCLAALVGYKAYISKRKLLSLSIFIGWISLTSPVHGSKGLISTFLFLCFMPWLRKKRFLSFSSILMGLMLTCVFLFGLYLRNIEWITIGDLISYALNYFNTLSNLILLLSDYEPGFLETFFLPFNKFLTPIGLSDPLLYYDMNHMLTDKYFPNAWKIRATEQWPVEADLYLNFYFIFGLPLVFLYTYVIGFFYGRARLSDNLGTWVVTVLLMTSIVSHLRGSIINHTDFYLYPIFFLIYLLLRGWSLRPKTLFIKNI